MPEQYLRGFTPPDNDAAGAALDVPNDPECTCGSTSPRAYEHALSCPHSTPWNDRVKNRLTAATRKEGAMPDMIPRRKRTPEMDAIMKHIHGNPEYSLERVAARVKEAFAKSKLKGTLMPEQDEVKLPPIPGHMHLRAESPVALSSESAK